MWRSGGKAVAWRGSGMGEWAVEQLSAGLDAKLSEHTAEVVVDGRRADVQLGGGFRVRRALGDEPGDLPLPGREVAAGLDRASSRGLTGGGQLGTGALGEGGAGHDKSVLGGAESFTGISTASASAKPFAVQQVPASELHSVVAVFELEDRFEVEVLGELVAGHQGARSRQQAHGERRADGAGRDGEALENGGGRTPVAAAHAGLDEVGSSDGDVWTESAGRRPLQHPVRGVVVAEAELEHAKAIVEMRS